MWTVNFQMFKLVLERQRNQRSNCQYLLDHQKSKRVPEKHLFSSLLTVPKSLTVWITINCGKFWKRWEYQSPSPASWETCRSGKVSQKPEKPGQEATVRTEHGTTDWFQRGKGVCQGCILSPCLFNLHAEYIIRNDGLDEAQAGIKIAGRNISDLRYADDTALMAESE